MINVFIIGAISSDGFIAQNTSHSPMSWTSKDDKKRFVELTKRAGVVILGGNTFKTFPKPLKDRLNIVYSRTLLPTEGIEVTSEDPKVLIKKLEERGFKEVAICGGSEIYTMFMNAGVVDHIHLTIEPVLFGTGMPLFNKPLELKLELVSTTHTESGTVFNDYKIIK